MRGHPRLPIVAAATALVGGGLLPSACADPTPPNHEDRATATEPARPRSGTPPAAPGPGGLHRAHGLDGPAAAAFERGVTAYNADDVDAAVEAFEETVRLAPESAEAHINLGFVYLRLQRTADAIRELEAGDQLAQRDRQPTEGEADPDGNEPS